MSDPNEGICPECVRPKIVALHEGLCKWHFDKVKKVRKSIEPVSLKSDKQAELDKKYNVIARAYKAKHPICQAQLTGCTKNTTDIHHRAGRQGANYLDESKFLAVCRHCHVQIELKSHFAKALGLSESRLSINTEQ